MYSFNCHGWLAIGITDLSTVARIKIEHFEDHIHYCTIDVPEDVKELVRASLDKTPSQVRR